MTAVQTLASNANPPTRTGKLRSGSIVNIVLITAVVALLVYGQLTQPTFLSMDNLITVLRAAALTGIAAIGMTFLTLSGNFVSLSTEQTAIFSGIVFAMSLAAGWPLLPAILVTFVVAVVLGVIQGAVVALGMNAIVTTLGAGAAILGLASVITANRTINTHTDTANWLGTSRPLGVPIQVIIFAVLVAVTMVVLKKTTFGRSVMLLGENREAAKASGLKVASVIIRSFIIAAVFAAICGILLISQVTQAKTTNFDGLNIDVVAAVLIGGTAIGGGEGSTLRTALGAIFIALLTNYMLISQFPYGERLVIQGLVVAVAVVGFHLMRKKAK
ncbi:ABC transporter permease [Rhodococcus sp. NPDC057014]|uniref:ABC transporter permease n=1 Tax=Rhodococcus sp. NPDC057014 TaxID=3346000 RepID=UPI003626AF5A